MSAPVPEASSALLAKQVKIPAEAIPDDVQVETFVDNDFPRPAADDIYFVKKRSAMAAPAGPSKLNPFYLLTPIFGMALLTAGIRRKRA